MSRKSSQSSPPDYTETSMTSSYPPFDPATEPLSLPLSDDPPAVVREYLYDFLHRRAASHNLSPDDIVKLCDSWHHGRGAELATYDVETWRAMMGQEIGPILHSAMAAEHIKLRIKKGMFSLTTDGCCG